MLGIIYSIENIFIDIFQMNQLKHTDDRQFKKKKKEFY